MQFYTIFTATALAITVSAAPAITARAPEGLLDLFSNGGCLAETKCFTDFHLQRGCTPLPTDCHAAAKLTVLGNNCTVKLYTDAACTSANVITITNKDVENCENPSSALGAGSVEVICTD